MKSSCHLEYEVENDCRLLQSLTYCCATCGTTTFVDLSLVPPQRLVIVCENCETTVTIIAEEKFEIENTLGVA
jgi:hypothetical protein